jgi:mannose/cellobiose epimerase-like protein (N-acyl-D-glucosamine 2-epimerase family)
LDKNGPRVRHKLAYGHAFVLLAASSAKTIGHPDANALLEDIVSVLDGKFWEKRYQASAEEFREDWSPFDNYRGQNANMHLTEALMAAFEATGERDFLKKAQSIAERIIDTNARHADWRVPEHYRSDWTIDSVYKGSDMFRPFGYTPGHALEWSRLVMQLHALTKGEADWAPEAARGLFRQAIAQGWDPRKGGFYYTLEYDGKPRVRDRLWWPICEGAAAAYVIGKHDDDAFYEEWYRRIFEFADANFIDHANGGWRSQLDDKLRHIPGYFVGKPDIYHALQACLIPLHTPDLGLVAALAKGK